MDLIGTTIAQYQILEQIGQGGMATVYKAYQPSLDRYVALKILAANLAQTEEFIARFEREAKIIAKLRHRNILTIFDYGHREKSFYLAMEYVNGGTLKECLGWPHPFAYAVDITTQIGQALTHAHRQGIIHRDIKPANILVAEDDWLLLSDFGLVKMIEDSLQLTLSGASLGTPQYMSPEQAQGLEIDQRSDIYSLGVVLYEAVTGRPPFSFDNPVALIMKQISDPIPPPHTLRSDIPAEMEQVILKALAKSPEERYQRMETFLAELQAAYALIAPLSPSYPANGQVELDPQSCLNRTRSVSRIHPTLSRSRRSFPWLGLIIGACLLFIVILTLLLFKDSMTALASSVLTNPVPTPRPSPTRPAATPGVTVVAEINSSTDEFTLATVISSPTPAPPLPSSTPTSPPPQSIQLRVWQADGAEMVFVPAGPFTMGSETLGDDERPVRQVYLDNFWIDRYEVTNARFARFVAETKYQTEAEQHGWGWVRRGEDWEEVKAANWHHPQGPDSSIESKMDHPVVLVSWNDAEAYCRWAQKGLPTEAEWEKAARGPSPDIEVEQPYAWGTGFDTRKANTKESNQNDTTPVGYFSPQGDSPYGAADLTGNVWEWVADWYSNDYYHRAPSTNPPGPPTGTDKVLRGGSWLFDAFYARTAFRYNIRPDYTYDFAGFRCSRQ